ncbi:MAG: AAA family ATPase [Solirubrobacteraceae bacterium]
MTGSHSMLSALGLPPHAATVLSASMPPHGTPSHAYLLHGPPGSGKRAAARALAVALLADGAPDPEDAGGRAARDVHPDLAWVRPSGAAEMLVSDIEEPVVAAASRTPFEARRRVFVVEGADVLGERAANKLLKTLEEPADHVCLILLAARAGDVLPTIVSRCQLVRFDPPPPELIVERLAGAGGDGADPAALAAAARLCLGDQLLAQRLASAEGTSLRESVEAFAADLLRAAPLAAMRPWSALLEAAKGAGEAAAEQAGTSLAQELELLAASERRRREREASEAARRAGRRERTRSLELALRLLELWLRDLLCVREGVPEAIHATDRLERLSVAAADLPPRALRAALELVCETRLRLDQNVSEELALEAMAYRVQAALAA